MREYLKITINGKKPTLSSEGRIEVKSLGLCDKLRKPITTQLKRLDDE